jgi:flagellar FliJ protein
VQAIAHKAQRQEQKQTDEMALSIHLRQSLAQAQARN